MYKLLKRIINKLFFYFQRPGELFRYSSPRVRSIYNSICKCLFFFSFRKRKKYFKSNKKIESLTKKNGHYSTKSFSQEKFMLSAIDSAKNMISRYLESEEHIQQSKAYLHTIPFEKDFNLDHPIMKLATSDELVDIATSYLNFLPILSEIRIWYSPNTSTKKKGSQLFHLDYADINQLKVFIPIENIDEDSGPLTFIPSDSSKKICDNINYKLTNDEIRVEDEIVEKYVNKDDYRKATGSPGDLHCVDTSSCLHYGSRGATKNRKILMIQYLSPFSFSYPLFYKNKTTFSHLSSPHSNSKLKLLLGSE